MARGGRGSDINPNFLCVSSAGLRYERCRCQISLICRHLFSWSHHKQQVMWFYLRMLLKQQPWNANEGWNNNCLCREEPTHISEISQGVNNLEAVILSIFEANVDVLLPLYKCIHFFSNSLNSWYVKNYDWIWITR